VKSLGPRHRRRQRARLSCRLQARDVVIGLRMGWNNSSRWCRPSRNSIA
jgi:hypothetical protein